MRPRIAAWRRRVAAALRPAQLDADLRDEIEAHRALLQGDLERRGLRADDAARASRRAMGSFLLLREGARDAWLGSWDAWWQDLRLAGRGLRRTPGFAVSAVLTLVIGLTGAIAMFTVIHGVLLRPLPVPHESRLFVGWRALPEAGARHWPFRGRQLDLLRRESRLLEGVAGVGYNDPGLFALADRDATTLVRSARVTGEFFGVLGVEPILGRTLIPRDDMVGAENVLVITHHLWQSRYGGSHDVLGRRVRIGDQPFTIVGVMPPDCDYPRQVEAWMTVAAMQTTASTFREAMRLELDLLIRVREGVSAGQAAAELRALALSLETERIPRISCRRSSRTVTSSLAICASP